MRKKLCKESSYFDLIKSDNDNYLTKKKIVISDCDGVLTDGTSIYSKEGKTEKVYGAYDSEMINFLKLQGWEFLFVSKDKLGFNITSSRINDLNCKLIEANEKQRNNFVNQYIYNGYTVLFVGDSLTDIKSMSDSTYAACPHNSPVQVYEYADFVSKNDGGHGAFGEILLWVHNLMKSN